MHTKMMSIGKRIPLVASIAFQAFSFKAPSIDEPSCLTANATKPAELLAANGGREAVIARGDLGFTPAPGVVATFQ